MWVYIKRYRTVLFHASYGVTFAIAALLGELRAIDLSPFFSPTVAPMVGSGIAVGAVVLHFFANAHFGSIRDDGTGGINTSVTPPIVNPMPPDTIVNTEEKR
jgi:hypothetical protein